MKTILIPTDFSLSAKNASRYAMHLAKEMKANIKLCNAIMIPVEVPTVNYVSVPLPVIETLEQESKEELERTAKKMTELDQLETANDSYHPLVEYETKIGNVSDMVLDFVHDHNVNLVVMGMSGEGGLSQFLLGSASRAMIEAATLPILLVPINARFRHFNKIAFATDLSEKDITVIHMLASFARIFNAEILIVHISDQVQSNEPDSRNKIKEFLNGITYKVKYHKIYYQHVLNDTVDDGLNWLAKYGEIQMLAMVHRKHDVLHKIFKGSHTQKLRKKIEIPLLVFPSDCSDKML